MCIRSTGPEGGHPGDAGIFAQTPCFGHDGPSPGSEVLLHEERRAGKIDLRIRLGCMQARRQLPVPQLQDHFRQACDAGCTLSVAYVGLHGAHRAVADILVGPVESLRESGDLYRISQRGARAVGLDIADCTRGNPGPAQRGANQFTLRAWIRDRIAVCFPSVIQAGGEDDCMDGVAVRKGGAQALQQDDTDALPRNEPFGTASEAAAVSIFGQHGLRAQRQVSQRVKMQMHSAGERQLALAPQQVSACLVNGRERGRAHRVDRHTGAIEVENIRDSVRHGTERGVGEEALALLP